MQSVRRQLLARGETGSLLVDGTGTGGRMDRSEAAVWQDWPGPRIAPKRVLGEGWAAGAAWQCIAAIDALANGGYGRTLVSVAGAHEQAIGAVFSRS
jgi:hypothetical protein